MPVREGSVGLTESMVIPQFVVRGVKTEMMRLPTTVPCRGDRGVVPCVTALQFCVLWPDFLKFLPSDDRGEEIHLCFIALTRAFATGGKWN